MLATIVNMEQQLKRDKKASLLPLFKKSLEKSFQIVILKLANRFVRR
jgi:hypothetical protein